ncbi:MAG: hypothetical protein KAR38_17275, partial [Calditrichia bacterium]|nr:hypothetical protein [Calditrichia bacterium]
MLSNRPLNATLGSSLTRLAKPHVKFNPSNNINVEKTFDQFLEAENLILHFLKKNKLGNLPVGSQTLENLLGMSPILRQYINNLQDLDQYNQFLYGFVLQKLNLAKNVYVKSLPSSEYKEGIAVFEKYGKSFSFLIENVKSSIIHKMISNIKPINKITASFLPEKYKILSLAQKVLLILTSSHPNLIVLNGMRHLSYVIEALKIMGFSQHLSDISFLPDLSKEILDHY